MGNRLWRVRFDIPLTDWISFHLKSKRNIASGNELPWSSIFCVTLWQIWKDRNRKGFDNTDNMVAISSKTIVSYTNENVQAFKSSLHRGFTRPVLIKWVPPCAGKIKLNTDGCWYESNRNTGFGGLLRDVSGDWILGYFGKAVCESSLKAEIWGIHGGLTIILEKSMSGITIESDALIAVDLINEGHSVNHT